MPYAFGQRARGKHTTPLRATCWGNILCAVGPCAQGKNATRVPVTRWENMPRAFGPRVGETGHMLGNHNTRPRPMRQGKTCHALSGQEPWTAYRTRSGHGMRTNAHAHILHDFGPRTRRYMPRGFDSRARRSYDETSGGALEKTYNAPRVTRWVKVCHAPG